MRSDVDLRSFGPVLLLLGQEIMIGAVLGMTARLALSALQVAEVIGYLVRLRRSVMK